MGQFAGEYGAVSRLVMPQSLACLFIRAARPSCQSLYECSLLSLFPPFNPVRHQNLRPYYYNCAVGVWPLAENRDKLNE
jgi:hypothetical protein